MIRQRVSTLLTTVSLLLSLTAAVALPASTLAAIPTVASGRGTEASPITGPSSAEPMKVSPGAYAQFSTWARNDDTSTISQFFLTETTGKTIYSASWTKSDGTTGDCPAATPLACSFGQLKPDEFIDAVIVLQTTGTASPMPVRFVWSTVGIGHGDSFPVDDQVGLKGGDDFSGRFLVGNASLVVGDAEGLSSTNKQSTVVFSPTTGIGVSVEDGSGPGVDEPVRADKQVLQ